MLRGRARGRKVACCAGHCQFHWGVMTPLTPPGYGPASVHGIFVLPSFVVASFVLPSYNHNRVMRFNISRDIIAAKRPENSVLTRAWLVFGNVIQGLMLHYQYVVFRPFRCNNFRKILYPPLQFRASPHSVWTLS